MSSKFIPLSVPSFVGNEWNYVKEAVSSEWVSSGGAYIEEFEEKIANYVGSQGAVACQSGTAGLHTALILAGVGENDEVIVPTLTFIAAVNPVKYVNAEPIFIDCDDSLTVDPDKLRDFCKYECDLIDGKLRNKSTGKHVKALIVVHVFGNMADMESIIEICKKYNITVIEDATEALGTYYTSGKYHGMFAGTLGDIGVYSFNGNKIITTGGGGMIVSNHSDFLKRAKHLTTQAKSDPLYYTHDEIGYNYRMTNLQAALGVAQLEQLESFIEIKKSNYETYCKEIKQIKGSRILPFRQDVRPNYWFYSLYLDDNNRDHLIKYFQDNGIQTRPIWGLISEQIPYLQNQTYKIEKAAECHDHIVNIPCSSNLNRDDVKRVVSVLHDFYSSY
ncbi:LegC family aminotransferase [Fusibacter sp. JL216-2]|uniref:LegC family aminotransferase n=1 Tax=Fusibacter sp. JL216-2 TaxID=3071453 RepID=UPI003D352F76